MITALVLARYAVLVVLLGAAVVLAWAAISRQG